MNHTTLYDEGCAQGTAARQTFAPQDLAVVLDVGGPAIVSGTYGATLFAGTNQTIATIREAVKWYAIGFFQCSDEGNTDHLRLAIGTNNSTGGDVTNAHGKAWGTMINALNTWAAANPEGAIITFCRR